jgi:hypothetical protein
MFLSVKGLVFHESNRVLKFPLFSCLNFSGFFCFSFGMYISVVVGANLLMKIIIFKPIQEILSFFPRSEHSVWECDGLIGSFSSI